MNSNVATVLFIVWLVVFAGWAFSQISQANRHFDKDKK